MFLSKITPEQLSTGSIHKEARRPGKVQVTLVDIAGLIGLFKSKALGVTPLGNDIWKVDQAYFDKFKQAGTIHSANKKLFTASATSQ